MRSSAKFAKPSHSKWRDEVDELVSLEGSGPKDRVRFGSSSTSPAAYEKYGGVYDKRCQEVERSLEGALERGNLVQPTIVRPLFASLSSPPSFPPQIQSFPKRKTYGAQTPSYPSSKSARSTGWKTPSSRTTPSHRSCRAVSAREILGQAASLAATPGSMMTDVHTSTRCGANSRGMPFIYLTLLVFDREESNRSMSNLNKASIPEAIECRIDIDVKNGTNRTTVNSKISTDLGIG
ncbi:hypothetical protein A7U60_g1122 [Sanghuangporus baumii]|uniref:Uncharacterized protein n=1 Tax=Sanghuangporus baumii TaxID=108892 RepID=A0A9Q5NBH8_SANBA|nr:hypothetical protein A7U60_g1122 [Sanghuangporus baumii]